MCVCTFSPRVPLSAGDRAAQVSNTTSPARIAPTTDAESDILECINTTLAPKGVAVVIEASHMCMMMRGVQKQNSVTTTSGFRGLFRKTATRNEFMKLISSSLS